MLTIKRLSIDEAKLMITASEKKSDQIGIPMCIAVTDESGNLLAFSRMDGGKVSSISIAIDKAFTASAAKNPTAFYNEMCRPGSPTFGIHTSNQGGIGASSGTPAQDIEVAEAGLAALEAHWKRSKSGTKRR
jgi:uncharacterized protein GlcG (DUF336 family)